MIDRTPSNIVYLILVANRKQKDKLLSRISSADCKVISTIYAKGSVKAGYLVDMLGFVPEENKVVITCMLAKDKVQFLFEMLLKEFNFGEPNTGIAFTVPLLGISF